MPHLVQCLLGYDVMCSCLSPQSLVFPPTNNSTIHQEHLGDPKAPLVTHRGPNLGFLESLEGGPSPFCPPVSALWLLAKLVRKEPSPQGVVPTEAPRRATSLTLGHQEARPLQIKISYGERRPAETQRSLDIAISSSRAGGCSEAEHLLSLQMRLAQTPTSLSKEHKSAGVAEDGTCLGLRVPYGLH